MKSEVTIKSVGFLWNTHQVLIDGILYREFSAYKTAAAIKTVLEQYLPNKTINNIVDTCVNPLLTGEFDINTNLYTYDIVEEYVSVDKVKIERPIGCQIPVVQYTLPNAEKWISLSDASDILTPEDLQCVKEVDYSRADYSSQHQTYIKSINIIAANKIIRDGGFTRTIYNTKVIEVKPKDID